MESLRGLHRLFADLAIPSRDVTDERIQTGGSFDTIAGTIENMFDFTKTVK